MNWHSTKFVLKVSEKEKKYLSKDIINKYYRVILSEIDDIFYFPLKNPEDQQWFSFHLFSLGILGCS